jgi:two-component system, response regulator YesN
VPSRSWFSRRKSVLFGWLLSYLMILAVPLVVTILTQVRTASILEKEITDAHMLVLRRMRERMDAQVETAWRLAQEIAFSPRLAALNRGFTPPPPGGYEVYEISRDFRTYRTLYALIEDIYLYIPRVESILSPAGLVDTRTFYQTYLRDRGVPYETWRAAISRPNRGAFALLAPAGPAAPAAAAAPLRDDGLVLYLQSTPLFTTEPDANVAISLSTRAFVEEAGDLARLNNAAVFVIDGTDRVVAASTASRPPLRYRDLPDREGLIRERGDRGPVIGSSIASQVTDWKYLVLVPREVFWRKAEAARRLAFGGFLLCVVLGGALVVASLKRNYNPVGELVGLMERFQGRDYGREESEFGFIRRAIAQAEEEREKYGIIVAQQDRTLRENLLRRLLKGAVSFESGGTLADRLYLHGVRFAGDRFVAAALYIADYDEVFEGGDGEERDAYDEYRKVQFIMAAAFQELLAARGHAAFVVDVDDLLAVLVSLGPASGPARQEIEQAVAGAAARLGDRLRAHFLTAVGAEHRGIDGIPQAWAEALHTMEYKRLLGIEGITYFDDVAEAPQSRYGYPPETERRLINAVRTGDEATAGGIVRGVFESSFAPGRLSPGAARLLMHDLASTMIKALEESGDTGRTGPEGGAAEGGADPVERLAACETAQELEREIRLLLSSRCTAVREELARRGRAGHRARRLSEQVAEKVASDYADPLLDIGALARAFDVHPISLSRIYHEETGEGLLEAINRVRIERAKALMQERPADPLEEIGRCVGYGSTRTFTRAFRRREGVTPGRYKASLQGAGDPDGR